MRSFSKQLSYVSAAKKSAKASSFWSILKKKAAQKPQTNS
jgi:hypothetical protein